MSGGRDEWLRIEVVFALRDRQELVTLRLPNGATVADAIERSSIQSAFPEWNLSECAVGVWGLPAERGRRLKQGDRVEIYRPLTMDPRDARRALAAQDRSMGKSTGRPGASDERDTGED
jgi:hypothetical protein